MLGLGKQIGGNVLRVARVIGQHHKFARAGQKVDRDMANEQALGSDDVRIARPENLLHTSNAIGAERHCSDGLRAPEAIDFRGARLSHREQQRRIY